MKSAPAVSVVVPTQGRPSELVGCLQALAGQAFERQAYEVIVVDDGSPEPLDRAVVPFRDRLRVRLVRQANAGPGAARNTGAAMATGTLLAFTDDDCEPAPDWLDRLWARFEAEGECVLGGRSVNGLPGNRYAGASQLVIDLVYAFQLERPDGPRFFASNNLGLPAEGFRRIGGFDENFRLGAEDRDLCARWRHLGGRLVYAPEAVIRHCHALTAAGFLRQHFAYGRGAWRYLRARRRVGQLELGGDLRFYGYLARRAREAMGRRSLPETLSTASLLLAWQAVYNAGFLYELIVNWSGRGGRRRARAAGAR